jgi:hypothetical protein
MMWIGVDNGSPAIRVGVQPEWCVIRKAQTAYGKIMQASALIPIMHIFPLNLNGLHEAASASSQSAATVDWHD